MRIQKSRGIDNKKTRSYSLRQEGVTQGNQGHVCFGPKSSAEIYVGLHCFNPEKGDYAFQTLAP